MELRGLIKHFDELYGERNNLFLSGPKTKILFLMLGVSDLQDTIRKQATKPKLNIALARVVSRIFCVVNHFGSDFADLFIETLARKYPPDRCSYCGKSPCDCSEEKRSESKLAKSILVEQLHWSLNQWQGHMKDTYGEANKKLGKDNIMGRLFREVGELLSFQMEYSRGVNSELSRDKIKEEIALELGDVLSWTMAIANIFQANLEEAVSERFGEGCWKCGKKPCVCAHFSYEQVRWNEE